MKDKLGNTIRKGVLLRSEKDKLVTCTVASVRAGIAKLVDEPPEDGDVKSFGSPSLLNETAMHESLWIKST